MNFIMNKYLFFTTISIVPIITFIEPSYSSSPCYLIDANGNQVNLGFVCDVIKPTIPTNSTVTTPSPPTATNNTAPPVQTLTNVGNVIITPQEQTPQLPLTRRNLRVLRNQRNSSITNP